MIKTIYLNLEDDIAKVTSKLKREKASEVVLVFPKKSFLFSDSINLRLLKKQVEMLGKKVSILTMDEVGQMYAKEAGFDLKFLPKSAGPRQFSDIRSQIVPRPPAGITKSSSVPEKAVSAGILPKLTRRKNPAAAVPAVSEVRHRYKTNDEDNRSPLLPLVKPKQHRSGRSFRSYLIGFVALALVIIIALVTVILPSADIAVYAKAQTLSRDIDLSVDTKTTQPDAGQLKLPAIAVDETRDISQVIQTSGKQEVGSKAQGRVAIYNLTGSPINLKSTTTVLSAGSKNYTFNVDQNSIRALPSATQDQNATVADITAQGGGESYNLPAGTRLEITNQAFGSQPQRLWAKTVTQVIGGNSRFISVITRDDIQKAQAALNQAAVDKIRQELSVKNLTLIDAAYTATPAAFSTDKPEGTETPSFTGSTNVRVAGLAFNQDELIKLLRNRVNLSLSGDQILQDISQDTMTIKVKNLDLASGILSLTVHYESKALPQIDTAGVRQQLAGKSKSEAVDVLMATPQIERVDITLSPSWQTSLPRLGGKIRLEVKR